ncbi:MAG: hypothetical protein EOP84_12690 [Verrucomicrobiaceae bacterium]|nr:MAG: hypothetical protein EOP84_12690 [Verrucomicrobiaceae bacterium]
MIAKAPKLFGTTLIFVFVLLLNSCFTASVFSLPQRKTEAANKRQDYLAAVALPVAVVADVATSPIQVGAIGVYSAAKIATRPKEVAGNQPEERPHSEGNEGKK